MSSPGPIESPFRLAEWTIFPKRHTVSGPEGDRRLSAKGMSLLLHFASLQGQVLSKDQLIDAVWSGSYTSDEALSTVIYELRRVLGDSAREARFIETIRKSGYRLVATIEPVPLTTEKTTSRVSSEATDPIPSSPTGTGALSRPTLPNPRPLHKSWTLVVILLIGCLVLIALTYWQRPQEAVREPQPEIESLAVLPLATHLMDDRELLDTALTDMLVGDIAQACSIDVTPGLALRRDSGPWDIAGALEVLGVDAVVEGAVARSGDNLWISLQLVDLRTGRMLWSATYDRKLGDELLVLREVTQDAALRIRDELGRRQKLNDSSEIDPVSDSEFIPQEEPK